MSDDFAPQRPHEKPEPDAGDDSVLDPLPYRSTLAGHPYVGSLIPTFVVRLPAYVRQLETLLTTQDAAALQHLAHQLKGAGSSYGFAPISACALRIEQALHARPSVSDAASIVQSLITYMRHVEGYREN